MSQEKLNQALVIIEKISEKMHSIEAKQANFIEKITGLKAQKLRFLEKIKDVENREQDFREKLSQIQEAHADLSQKQNLALKAVKILQNNLKDTLPEQNSATPLPSKILRSELTPDSFFTEIEQSLQQSKLQRQTIKRQDCVRTTSDSQFQSESNPLEGATITTTSEQVFNISELETNPPLPPSSDTTASSSWGIISDVSFDLLPSSETGSTQEVSPSVIEDIPEPFEEATSHLCIICHSPVAVSVNANSNLTLGLEYVSCPNLHYLHYDCVKKWLERSDKCPVCHEQYDKGVLAEFGSYIESQKKEKEAAKQRQEDQKKAKKKAQQREAQEESSEYVEIFQKALTYFEEDKFKATLDTLWALYDAEHYPKNDRRMLKVLFYISLTYYSIGKYAQSVQQLMNIAKVDFEYPLVFYYLGLCYHELEIPDKTKWALERAFNNTGKLAKIDQKYEVYLPKIEEFLKQLK